MFTNERRGWGAVEGLLGLIVMLGLFTVGAGVMVSEYSKKPPPAANTSCTLVCAQVERPAKAPGQG